MLLVIIFHMKELSQLPLVQGSAGNILCRHRTLVFHRESSEPGLAPVPVSLHADTHNQCLTITIRLTCESKTV